MADFIYFFLIFYTIHLILSNGNNPFDIIKNKKSTFIEKLSRTLIFGSVTLIFLFIGIFLLPTVRNWGKIQDWLL